MGNIKKIQSIKELMDKKAELRSKLSTVNEQIEMEQGSCDHIDVNLGNNKSTLNNIHRCLICGKGKNEYFFDSKYIVHAENYLTNFDISDEKQCDDKFDILQIMALGIIKDNPSMDNLELTNRFNQLIEESITQKKENSTKNQEKQLVKK